MHVILCVKSDRARSRTRYANTITLSCCLLARCLPTGRHQDDPIRAGLMDQQVAVPRRPHVPQNAGVNASRRDRPALESLCFGIESDERIRSLARLVVPDNIVHYGDGISVSYTHLTLPTIYSV